MYTGLKNGVTEHYRELITSVIKATYDGNLVETVAKIPEILCVEGKETNLQSTLEEGLIYFFLYSFFLYNCFVMYPCYIYFENLFFSSFSFR